MAVMEQKEGTIFFKNFGSKEKLKTTDIENILSLSSFDRLIFSKCQLSKAYKKAFAYLIHNHHHSIKILQIHSIDHETFNSISTELCQFISSQCCSSLTKLIITSDTYSPDLTLLFDTLSKCNSLQQSLHHLQIEDIGTNESIKIDKTFSHFLYNSCFVHQSLKILNLRNIGFSAKQNYNFAIALTQCLWPNGKNKKHKKGSHRCSITEFYFGGSDCWNQRGMETMCQFIKYNHNLEILGIELLNASKDVPFISNTDATSNGVLVLSINDHPSLQRLEVYHIQTYTLKVFGDQWEKRIKGESMRLTELFLHQVHQNTGLDPRCNTVLPAILKITKKIPWLQLMQLRISVFCNLFEVKELCKILMHCKHLNGLTFHCKMGEMFGKKQIVGCVEHIVDTFKEMKKKNVSEGRKEIIDAIESNLVIANDGNVNVDKDIAVVVLSYADISYAFDAGLLFFESTFLNKLDFKDKIAANEWLLNNWKKLPFNGEDMNDERYKNARGKLMKFEKRIQRRKSMKKLK